MKKSVLKSVLAAIAVVMMSCTTTANAQTGNTKYIYGQNDTNTTVYTLNEDGKTLTPKWKYEYRYDEQRRLTEKKAYRWNLQQQMWTPAYLLTIMSNDSICIMDYAEWDKLFCNFERNRQQSVYYVDSSNALLTYYSRSSACEISENNK